jgi:hypothetical protein
MFPKLKQLDIDFQQLGQELKERKAELMGEMGVELEEESEDETA